MTFRFSGSKLRAERRRRHLTQYDLADLTGYEQPQISQWETDRHVPCHFAMLALGKAVETDTAAFFETEVSA